MAMRTTPPTQARHSHPCATRPPATTRARQSHNSTTHAARGLLPLLPQPTMAPSSTSTRTTAPPAPRCLPYQTPSYPTHTPSTLSPRTSPRSPSASTRLPSPTRRLPHPILRPAQARMPRTRPWPVQTTPPLPLPAPPQQHTISTALRLCETCRRLLPPATQQSAPIP